MRNISSLVCGLLLIAPLQTTWAQGQAQTQEEFFEFDGAEAQSPSIADPLESFNRASFVVNDKLYRYALKPVARGLRILPAPVRTSFSNFFSNLETPVSAVAALLQGEGKNAATELGRFAINTTVGLAGFLDPATDIGLLQDEEDFGQTLASYGVGQGFYLVVPLLGATSARDLVGNVASASLNPLYNNVGTTTQVAVNVANVEVALSLDKDTYEAFYDSALDPYVFFRSAWVQNRAGQIEQ
jgi:phospholipid-binding lipoprotein MlaA